jgi:hypothetical protein
MFIRSKAKTIKKNSKAKTIKKKLDFSLELRLRLNPRRLALLMFVVLILASSVFPITYLSNNYYDPHFQIWVDYDDRLDYEEAKAFAKRLYKIGNGIERTNWAPLSNDSAIRDWALEVTPMFEYENLVTETRGEYKPFKYNFINGFEHNHVAGRSNCLDFALVNARFDNRVSSWYRAQDWPTVLTHEIAHVQQGEGQCGFPEAEIRRVEELTEIINNVKTEESERIYAEAERKAITDFWAEDKALLENTAQVMSWEVMAALANQGNPQATLALAYELRGVSLSAAAAMAYDQGEDLDYEELLQDLYGDQPDKEARIAKNRRFWADKPEQLAALRLKYSWTPLGLVFSHRQSENIPNMALDNGNMALDNGTGWLEIDDLVYFLEHVEELVGWALKEV